MLSDKRIEAAASEIDVIYRAAFPHTVQSVPYFIEHSPLKAKREVNCSKKSVKVLRIFVTNGFSPCFFEGILGARAGVAPV